jgi:hypothetical protein
MNKKYLIVKKAISLELASFLYDYFIMKRKAVNHLFQNKLISPFTKVWGHFNDPQVLNTYSIYGDTNIENLLIKLKPLMEKETKNTLIEMYTYSRIYKHGDILYKHKDRSACQLSTTLFIGGDKWPIFLDGIKVDLNQGDMLIYKGCEQEHWREPFEGNNCVQSFLHYNIKSQETEKRKYDGRHFIGQIQV